MEAAPALNGPWSDVSGFNLAGMVGYEGPACYLVEPATADKPAVWCLILDHYAMRAGYQPYLTTDLSSGHFEPAEGFHFPYQHRHGSVLPLNPEEFDRIRAADTPNISNEKASS